MSYQVLARRWRPQKFEDVVGQGHIVKSIQNSLKEDRVGHAYIFSGTRGIGKTSIARIFAKALRCETRSEDGNACGSCNSCEDFNTESSMNVIEIDGASNNGVDDIRDLIGNIQYLPSTGKYKVYIIDEVHMLSTQAFNALLKTLEEPPEHAIFIMATTEPEKLLGTVLSRCQRFDFRHAGVQDLVEHIKKISEKEDIHFENEALMKELAKLGNGSFRDTLSLMDQVLSFSTDKQINEEVFARSLGVARISAIKDIIEAMITGDVQKVSMTFRKMIAENVSLNNIVKSTLESIFGIISSKDFKDYSRVSERIDQNVFDNVSRSELYWMYEVLSQDFSWSLESISPEDATEIVIRKVALRNDFIAEVNGGKEESAGKSEVQPKEQVAPVEEPREKTPVAESSVVVEEVSPPVMNEEPPMPEEPPMAQEAIGPTEDVEPKAIKIPIPTAEEVAKAKEAEVVNKENQKNIENSEEKSEDIEIDKPKVEGEKTWENFLVFLSDVSPASSANLEQGNLITPIAFIDNTVTVSLGFPQSAKVFFDYLNQEEAFLKLKGQIATYFSVDEEKVNLMLDLVDKEQAEKTDFKSKFEIKVKEEEIENQNKETEIANHDMIKHAEDIFGTAIDKIILSDKDRR